MLDILALFLILLVLALLVYIRSLKTRYENMLKMLTLNYENMLNKVRLDSERAAVERAQSLFNSWLNQHAKTLEDSIRQEYEARLQEWKMQEEEKIRRDATIRSLNTILGRVGEEFAPFYLVDRLKADPKDFRHIGSPVDYVVFKGLSDDTVKPEIIFLEIKTGQTSALTERERKVRDAVLNKRVSYEVVNLGEVVQGIRNRALEEINKLSSTPP